MELERNYPSDRVRPRCFVRASPAARGEADSSRRMTMNRFCTIDRISRCRSFVALENWRGLCPGREKIFAVGDPQYVHLCGKRLWQARRRITLFIPVEYWLSCFSLDMLDDPSSSRVQFCQAHARLNLNPISNRIFLPGIPSCRIHCHALGKLLQLCNT